MKKLPTFAPAMDINRHIDIMGIVNLTDDSYYARSRCADVKAAVELAGRHVSEGASVIDVGACSSRPGSVPVGACEEWNRLKPVLKVLRTELPEVMISVDTYWSEVVERAYDLIGGFIVNDISAGEDDPGMLPLVGRLGLSYVAMHKRGDSLTMSSLTEYHDVTEDVVDYFRAFAVKAEAAGIRDWIIDPGFGFAKTVEQNYELLRGLDRFDEIFPDKKLLVGVSRKSMIYKYLHISQEESLPATQVLHLAALSHGADILRVHDSAEACRTVSLYRQLG